MLQGRRTVLGGIVLAAAWVPCLRAQTDPTGALITTLQSARSYKLRVHAAAILARRAEPHGFAAIAHASAVDPDPAVRAVLIRLLAKNPGGDAAGVQARRHISAGLDDRSSRVRRAAREALRLLSKTLTSNARGPASPAVVPAPVREAPIGGRMTIAVGRMGGQAPDLVREYMRREVKVKLLRSGRVVVVDDGVSDVNFVLDGTIKQLTLNRRSREVEASAVVDLVLSRPHRGILLVASGEAVVQKSQRFLSAPDLRTRMMEEAVAHAVGSAHENLDRFLARQ